MRLDHIAYRVVNKELTARLLKDLFGYHESERFDITFDDGSVANSIAMVPPEKPSKNHPIPFATLDTEVYGEDDSWKEYVDYHLAPEIFVSEGQPGSIIHDWVMRTGGGIHHIAYEAIDVERVMETWRDKGIDFTTDSPIVCPDDDLKQAFTKPIPEFGGLIIELIMRGEKGFCLSSVKKLMESTQNVD